MPTRPTPTTLLLAAGLALAAGSPLAARAATVPLTLDEALALAARQSPDLALARADVRSARADTGTSRSAVLPRLDLTASFGHTFTGKATRPTIVIDPGTGQPLQFSSSASDAEAYSAQLQLKQTIFDWKTFRALQASSASERAQERTWDETTLQVSFLVTQRFYDLLKAERSLAVLEKTAARSEELVSRADALYAAGRSPKSETYSARANLSNDRINVEAQRTRVAQARTALAQALGGEEQDLEVVPPPALDAPGLPGGDAPPLDELLARARERRPSLLADRSRIAAAEANLSGASGGWLPSLAAQATYSRQGTGLSGAGNVYGPDPSMDYSASGQVVLSWNLFEGGRTSADAQRAAAARDRARAQASRGSQAVVKEIADARARVASLARQAALSAEGLEVARQAEALARQRLEAGLASQLEVRDASLKLTQAELSLVEARIDHAVASADLARAVGGSL